jgi:hypothetical protein
VGPASPLSPEVAGEREKASSISAGLGAMRS